VYRRTGLVRFMSCTLYELVVRSVTSKCDQHLQRIRHLGCMYQPEIRLGWKLEFWWTSGGLPSKHAHNPEESRGVRRSKARSRHRSLFLVVFLLGITTAPSAGCCGCVASVHEEKRRLHRSICYFADLFFFLIKDGFDLDVTAYHDGGQ